MTLGLALRLIKEKSLLCVMPWSLTNHSKRFLQTWALFSLFHVLCCFLSQVALVFIN